MITVDSISKRFKLYRTPADRLKEIITRKKYHTDFQALNNISFSVADGETLGIIGQNGAGKSTILKILTGILLPDSGTISIDGKITGLLELGTGFNSEMTGIENIYMNGMLLGMNRTEIDSKKNAITEFAELGEFIFERIKTYSSGMVMRLAFSIAIHADPKCFLVDEALSVGDAYFQQKCMRKIADFRSGGGSIIFVSHDMNAIKMLCDSAMLLSQGSILDYGEPKALIDLYQGMQLQKLHSGDNRIEIRKKRSDVQSGKDTKDSYRIGTGDVEVSSVSLLNEHNEEIRYLISENVLKIAFNVKAGRDLEDPHYGIMLRNKYGISVFETNTCCMGLKNSPLKKGDKVTVTFSMQCGLAPGDYSITIGIANSCLGKKTGLFQEYLMLEHEIKIIEIIENDESIKYGGFLNLNPTVKIEN